MMLIQFRLAWLKSGTPSLKGFKFPAAGSLFKEYRDRLSKFVPCESSGLNAKEIKKSSGVTRWLCDRHGKNFSSETLAHELQATMDRGTKQLEIIVGGPDGFSKTEIETLKPDIQWSFGPLTFPHELAAVIAAEQIYRAWTIIRKLPYHLGHS